MNRSALLSLYRSLARHKLYAALNIGGLAIGIAVFLILSLYVRFETSFEQWLPRHDGIYVVQTEFKDNGSPFSGTYQDTMGGLLEQMIEDFPSLVGTRINGGEDGGTVIRNGAAQTEDIARVDADFFRVFDLPMIIGEKATALRDPTAIVISQSAAQRYFGNRNPVGQIMTLAFEKPATYHITGVFKDLPRNSDLSFSILARQERNSSPSWYHWGSTALTTYLRFESPQAAQSFEQSMPAFIKRRGTHDMGPDVIDQMGLSLLPIAQAHLQPQGLASAAKKTTIITLGIVGVLTLLIAIVNYINLATARASLRAREVAMRKVLGADQGALVGQFLSEAILTVAIAALIGLIIAETGLPLVNAAGGLTLSVPYGFVTPILALLVLIVGVMAGLYPALLLARFPAAAVLASARAPGGGRAGTRTREALVVFQFGLAIAFMIGTAVLVAQARHVRSTDLGFQREGLLVVPGLANSSLDKARQLALLAALRRLPGVEKVTTANSAVGNNGINNFSNVDVPGRPKPGVSLRSIKVGRDFFETHGVRPIAGRVFDDAHGTDDSSTLGPDSPRNIVINRLAVARLGYSSPQDALGKTVGDGKLTIIGVIDQLRFYSPRLPDDPTYYTYLGDIAPDPVATLRFSGDPRPIQASVKNLWQRLAPQVPFDGDTGVHALAKFYQSDDHVTRLFGIGTSLAVLIGCVGLWGLASFNTSRRVREIGIRKTLGATSADIVKLLVGQFLRPVLIANLIAWPLAFFALQAWLGGFADRIALSPVFFIGPSLLAITIAVLTILGQSLRASRAAPAWALRHD